jgi:C1A family cysteine protease
MYASYEEVTIPETQEIVGTGWVPELPNTCDYTEETKEVEEMVLKLRLPPAEEPPLTLPSRVDLRQWCSAIENQGGLGSCTAHAGVGIVEYFERRAFGKHIDGSRLFVYKTTRNLLGWVGDTGAWVRTTMAALTLCGVPPEKYWPYTDRKQPGPGQERYFDLEPSPFVYSLAEDYEALKYFRHDPVGRSPAQVLASVKRYLASRIPSMFGFYGFGSFSQSNVKGGIPYPCPGERARWGHAIVAVGYDDTMKIKNLKCNKETTGAFLIRNSWGTGWGDRGYGWIPYEYVLKGLAKDFWSLLRMGWVNTGQFGL